MKTVLIFLGLLFLAGCSTYSKSECENFNWENIGYQSALRGDQRTEMPSHYRRECTQEHQVQINQEQFLNGYKKGLVVFCSADGGKVLGKSGRSYKGTCPKTAEETFLKSYDSGRLDFLVGRVSELEDKISRLNSDLSDKEREINNLESEISTLKHNTCP